MRLIDADWVLEHVKPYERSDEQWSVTGGTAIRLIYNAIDNAPTVDAVPVTRCRDCDGRRAEISWCGTYVRCGFRDATGLNMPEDGFCSLGKGGQ